MSMLFESKVVHSSQDGIHPRLQHYVQKHLDQPFQKPIQEHNLPAFEELQRHIQRSGHTQLILDSCCGTGLSTRHLALRNTNALIIGLDRSEKRLSTHSLDAVELPENALMLRANCEDIWRLCVQEKLSFNKHYLLYPNPYPKSEHLKRRWHGHPVFPYLPKLSASTELRSNWALYLEEMQIAWFMATGLKPELKQIELEQNGNNKPLTLFERKYHLSGQNVYKLLCRSETPQ